MSLRDNEKRATRGPPSNPSMQEMGCFHYSYVLYLMEFSCKKSLGKNLLSANLLLTNFGGLTRRDF